MSKLSDLNLHALEPERLADLRRRAAGLLAGQGGQGAQGTQRAAPNHPAEALTVLHALASSQNTAPEALTLLHELQVYQVELELQAQDLRESRTELEAALQRQITLYEHQPAGCFSVNDRLQMQELNQTGADLLGISRHDSLGLPLDAFFCADSASRFRATMARLGTTDTPGAAVQASCPVLLLPRDGPPVQALASASADPAGGGCLVNLMRVPAPPAPPGPVAH